MFEQERAADTEVDALQLDKRHPPIVTGASAKTALIDNDRDAKAAWSLQRVARM